MFTALRRAFGRRPRPPPMNPEADASFRNRCLEDLSPDLPLDRRIAAAYDLSGQIEIHSAENISHICRAAWDLTRQDATIEARRAGFAILKASASHPDNIQDREMLFDAIIQPVAPAEASLQISALDYLTQQGKNLLPFETEFVSFVNAALDTLFQAAQDARRRVEESSGRDQGERSRYSMIGEEKSLLAAFYLVKDSLTNSPTAFQEADLEIVTDRVVLISKKTTSRKTLHGVVKVLCALTAHVLLPPHEISPVLLVLFSIYKTPHIKFENELSIALRNILLPEEGMNVLTSILINDVPKYGIDKNSGENLCLLDVLTEAIFTTPLKTTNTLCTVLEAYSQFFLTIRINAASKKVFEKCLRKACQGLNAEQEVPLKVMNCLAGLAATCGPDITNPTFEVLLDVIEAKSGIAKAPHPTDNVADGIAECLIRLFLRCLPESALKTGRIYRLLILTARSQKPTVARLSVLKLLARVRCDSKQAVEIVQSPDTLGLAGILCRTEATASRQGSLRSRIHQEPSQTSPESGRQGRSSRIDIPKTVRSRSATRSSSLRDQLSIPTPPLWMYNDWTKGLPEDPRKGPSQVVYSHPPSKNKAAVLDLGLWLDLLTDVLKDGREWEIYSYVLVHLPSQLSNRLLFSRFVGQLQILHNLIIDHLERSSFNKPPQYTGMTGGDVALCLYHTLTVLLAYHEHLGRRELDNLVRAFSLGINKWDRAGKCCIHALALCCHEIPTVVDRHIFAITQKLSQKITQSDLGIDILEFLGSLARLPESCSTATSRLPETSSSTTVDDGSFFRTIFGICIGYIRSVREQRPRTAREARSHASLQSPRQSGHSGEMMPLTEGRKDFPEYVLALAYQIIIFWFLAIGVKQRAQHVGWIAKELAWKDGSGKEVLEEQSQVILDMMHRTVFSDLGETEPAKPPNDVDKVAARQVWLLGMSIVTVEVMSESNYGQIIKRQASGTTHASYRHNTVVLPEHHIRTHKATSSHRSKATSSDDSKATSSHDPKAASSHDPKATSSHDPKATSSHDSDDLLTVFPSHMLLQLTSTIAPVPIPLQPVKLPDDESVQRMLRNFDRIDTVDGHKAGVVYIGKGQTSEEEILANTGGSDAYTAFLSGLGTEVKLQGAKLNTQGLDREANTDGTHTYAWRDRVTEIVFHITTMMPTHPQTDPKGVNKKKHIGNDTVKIIFNNSGKAFAFDTINSDLNEINIVITPEAHSSDHIIKAVKEERKSSESLDKAPVIDPYGYYRVETLLSPKIPPLSAAAVPKLVSAEALPGFARQLALNASVYSQVWAGVSGKGEYISNWRARLQQIKKLREKYGNTHASANVSYPMPADADTPAYVEGDDWKGKVTLGGMAEQDQLLRSLDFTRWS